MVSGHLKSTGISRVDGLSTGLLDLGRHMNIFKYIFQTKLVFDPYI